jgi:methylase of polypeptide subunit release factors
MPPEDQPTTTAPADALDPAHHLPRPRLEASEADLVALRALLTVHHYDVPGICERTGKSQLYDFDTRAHARQGQAPEIGVDALVHLFLDCLPLDQGRVDELLGAGSGDLLLRLGLVFPYQGTLTSTVLMYPTEGLWLVSDRPVFSTAGLISYEDVPDLVYPAITASVRVFAATLPPGRGKRYLELCSGTGVAALIAAKGGAVHAWAVDITERSTYFAAFNARLNGLENATALEGDLFSPVAGQQFDCIVAHPPYMPATSTEMIFRDGGEDGEHITRAIIGKLPEFLATEGVFHCTCMITAREGSPALHRVRAMLGEAADDFDLILLGKGITEVEQYFTKQLLKADADAVPGIVALMKRFQALKVQWMEYGTIIIYRHGKARAGISMAVQRHQDGTWDQVAWLLSMQGLLSGGAEALDLLLAARPRLSPVAKFTLNYQASGDPEDPWTATEGAISVEQPTPGRVPANAGDAAFFASCTGDRTFAEILRDLQAAESIPADLPPHQFMHKMLPLVAEGVLETNLLPIPFRPHPT